MRRLVRSLCVVSALTLGAAMLGPPMASGRGDVARPNARVATETVVHGPGASAGAAQPRPTSFDRFSRRGRASGTPRAAGTSIGALPIVTAPSPRAPVSTLGFDAQTDLDGQVPSDTTGALGDTFFVTAVNIRVAVYDLAGTNVLAPTVLDSLHPDSLGHFAFDPKVVYDQYADMFLLVYLVQEDSPQLSLIVTVAIPDATASDTGTWCATSFPGDAVPDAPTLWADYPGVGFDEDRVAISTNQFTFPSSQGRFRSAQILSVPKSSLYDCSATGPVPDVFAGTQTRDPNGVQGFTLQPAQTVDLPATAQHFVSVQLAGKKSYLVVWRIKPTAAGLKLSTATIPIGRTTFPPPGTQGGGALDDPDTYWDAGDERVISAFYDADANQLFAAHGALKDFKPDTVTGGYPEAAVRWYEVSPGTKLKDSVLVRKGSIGAPEVDAGWPSVATDALGNLFVTYSRASQPLGEFLSAWVAEIPPGSTSATQLLLAPGLATYDAVVGLERWGDFTAINRSPVAAFVATFNQYALDGVTWQQVVHVVGHG